MTDSGESDALVQIQRIVESGCQDCVDLSRTFNPMYGWVWVLSDCKLDRVIEDFTLDDIERRWDPSGVDREADKDLGERYFEVVTTSENLAGADEAVIDDLLALSDLEAPRGC